MLSCGKRLRRELSQYTQDPDEDIVMIANEENIRQVFLVGEMCLRKCVSVIFL